MGWLVAIGILVLIGFLPLGVRALYDADGASVMLLIGPLKWKLYPGKKKSKKQSNETVKKPHKQPQKAPKAENKKGKGGSLRDFELIIREVLSFLLNFRRKLLVTHLELKVILAGGNPTDLAIQYGKSRAALGNLMPQLERFFKIKKRNLEVECDFTGSENLIRGRLDLVMTFGRMVGLAVVHGSKILREYLKLLKLRKGGMKT